MAGIALVKEGDRRSALTFFCRLHQRELWRPSLLDLIGVERVRFVFTLVVYHSNQIFGQLVLD